MKRIIVQAGHMKPFQPGFSGDTGARGEAELVADIQRSLVRQLNADGNFKAIPMPGLIDDSVQCDAAIFLHADGVTNPQANGFSMGFPDFEVNRRLANLITDEFMKLPGHPRHRGDNGTKDAAGYYGFRHVDTPGPEVLVEHGFTTNPAEHQWLKDNVDELARAELNALRRFFGLGVAATRHTTSHPAPATGPITKNSPLIGPARAPAAKAVRYLLERDNGEYTPGEVKSIVGHYYATGPAVGLDPLLLVAQMSEETARLSSFWSQRPRRNPAGIGVTGKPNEGISFPDWKTAVRAHTGRLLAYALAIDARTAAHRRLIDEALAFRDLPDDKHGVAPTLNGLSGRWAKDPDYAVKLASVANAIRTHP